MKCAVVLFSALALIGYAAAAVNPPWRFPPSKSLMQEYESAEEMDYAYDEPQLPQSEIQREIDTPTAETDPAAIQSVTTQSIFVNSMTSGAVEAVYRSPNKGRVTLNLINSKKDILIHVDARFNWYGWRNILVLNSKAANGGWQREAHPKEFPFPCCGYVSTITLRVEITTGAFVISANGIPVAKYPYRGALRPPVNQIQYVFEDTGASLKAKLESLTVDY